MPQVEFTESVSDMLWLWEKAAADLIKAKTYEMALRKKIVAALFPNPTEGTNTYQLPGEWKLKLTHKIDRKLDESALEAVWENLAEGSEDKLIKNKPSLIKKAYDDLTSEEQVIFNEALILKPGSPTLKLIEPKPTVEV